MVDSRKTTGTKEQSIVAINLIHPPFLQHALSRRFYRRRSVDGVALRPLSKSPSNADKLSCVLREL
jgi:hypothetical protein